MGMSCLNKRCPDDTREVDHPENDRRNNEGLVCYRDDPVSGGKFVLWEWSDFCYRRTVPCDLKRCPFGEILVGCGYASPGVCQRCPALAPGRFWDSKGSCAQNTCSIAERGAFVAKPCTSTSNAVIAHCSQYLGNRGGAVPRQDGRDTYYCPGGGLVLPLPENSRPTADYSNFECLPGFFQSGGNCLQCTPGFACNYGRKFECPAHYYSSAFGMDHCIICSRQCGSRWQYPLRCEQGSTADPGCVSCGACDFDPKRGMSCVTEAYEMQTLPAKCVPRDTPGSVAVCQT